MISNITTNPNSRNAVRRRAAFLTKAKWADVKRKGAGSSQERPPNRTHESHNHPHCSGPAHGHQGTRGSPGANTKGMELTSGYIWPERTPGVPLRMKEVELDYECLGHDERARWIASLRSADRQFEGKPSALSRRMPTG